MSRPASLPVLAAAAVLIAGGGTGCKSRPPESPYQASGEQAYWEGEKERAIREIYGPGNYRAAQREADDAERAAAATAALLFKN